jgi:hypothetical protein
MAISKLPPRTPPASSPVMSDTDKQDYLVKQQAERLKGIYVDGKPVVPMSVTNQQETSTNTLPQSSSGNQQATDPFPTSPIAATPTTNNQQVSEPVASPVVPVPVPTRRPLPTLNTGITLPATDHATKALGHTAALAALRARQTTLSQQQATIRQAQETIKALAIITPSKEVTAQIPEIAPIPEPSGRRNKHEVNYDSLNDDQKAAVQYAIDSKSFVLTGAAGTGKTTTQRAVIQALADHNKIRPVPASWEHKYLPKGIPSVAIVSYINKAVNNIRAALPVEYRNNALTIHKLLEYAPIYEDYDYINKDGLLCTATRRIFVPTRNAEYQIRGLTHIIVEESSTVNMQLFEQLLDALPNRGADIVWIFLGDICQIPPVFGDSVLAQMLTQLPVGALTKVYRQAGESPILELATHINTGVPISDAQLKSMEKPDQFLVTNLSGIKPDGTKVPRRTSQMLVHPLCNHFTALLDKKEFIPFRDVILMPFRQNKKDSPNAGGFNCEYLNMLLADHHGRQRGEVVYEVRCGYHKRYFALNDPVYFNKVEWHITNIATNPKYSGIEPNSPHIGLDRFGKYHGQEAIELHLGEASEVDKILAIDLTKLGANPADDETGLRSASHTLTLTRYSDDPDVNGQELEISGSGEIMDLDFAYCLSVHKSIGSEWEKVWCIFHNSHAPMMYRELLYTAVTRAKLFLHIFYDGQDHSRYKPNTSMINQAILSPDIKGTTIDEKLAWLRNKYTTKPKSAQEILEGF